MKAGDLVKVNKQCDAGGLWHKVGIMIGRKRRYEPGKTPLVRVLLANRECLFDYDSLDVVNTSKED